MNRARPEREQPFLSLGHEMDERSGVRELLRAPRDGPVRDRLIGNFHWMCTGEMSRLRAEAHNSRLPIDRVPAAARYATRLHVKLEDQSDLDCLLVNLPPLRDFKRLRHLSISHVCRVKFAAAGHLGGAVDPIKMPPDADVDFEKGFRAGPRLQKVQFVLNAVYDRGDAHPQSVGAFKRLASSIRQVMAAHVEWRSNVD